mmetsp:Transcript_20179/g.29952  ORF Transcript_20179/g.29952 Transcript_20179/m.29952 type:complete len:257 (+) Transcript_20179:106-876(+)|eukprot:CAMPEP_0194216818 /NCGR_PEP_ID=MMETSP0156-20130528/19739_1 /TAXON_ID=33649 /ORGANISM="Thalassionema nitzschioides, Strain L26-B" /LENGTH=256 /DNA_ID=CAMNT_0038945671 /DNA_START=1 /DNA_END=771 /DNA_ORIENTATION=+
MSDSDCSEEEAGEEIETNQSFDTTAENNNNSELDSCDDDGTAVIKKRKVFKLSLEKTEDFNEKLRKRGVIYLSRIPPRMNPVKVKQLLSEFGVVTRVFLVEEDQSVRKRRRKTGGSGAKRYLEGWVEFERKRIAKTVAASLNNTSISNQKRNVHYGELWNIKYLHKFAWSHLTEKVAYERRVREQKLRVELMHARKENAEYVQLVETGKKLDKIEERRKKRKASSISSSRKQPRQTKAIDEGTKMATKNEILKSLV